MSKTQKGETDALMSQKGRWPALVLCVLFRFANDGDVFPIKLWFEKKE